MSSSPKGIVTIAYTPRRAIEHFQALEITVHVLLVRLPFIDCILKDLQNDYDYFLKLHDMIRFSLPIIVSNEHVSGAEVKGVFKSKMERAGSISSRHHAVQPRGIVKIINAKENIGYCAVCPRVSFCNKKAERFSKGRNTPITGHTVGDMQCGLRSEL